jgi:hypothetical protein
VTDADFERAAKSGTALVQKPVQQAATPALIEFQKSSELSAACDPMRAGDAGCETSNVAKAPRVGLEPTTNRLTGESIGSAEKCQTPFTAGSLRHPAENCKLVRAVARHRENMPNSAFLVWECRRMQKRPRTTYDWLAAASPRRLPVASLHSPGTPCFRGDGSRPANSLGLGSRHTRRVACLPYRQGTGRSCAAPGPAQGSA